jgi:hypothetical protein
MLFKGQAQGCAVDRIPFEIAAKNFMNIDKNSPIRRGRENHPFSSQAFRSARCRVLGLALLVFSATLSFAGDNPKPNSDPTKPHADSVVWGNGVNVLKTTVNVAAADQLKNGNFHADSVVWGNGVNVLKTTVNVAAADQLKNGKFHSDSVVWGNGVNVLKTTVNVAAADQLKNGKFHSDSVVWGNGVNVLGTKVNVAAADKLKNGKFHSDSVVWGNGVNVLGTKVNVAASNETSRWGVRCLRATLSIRLTRPGKPPGRPALSW